MTGPEPSVIFVGRRNAAIRAARARELRYAVLQPEAVGELSRADLPAQPAAVFALTEAAVNPAAQLRERLGLPGVSVETAVRCTSKRAMKEAIAGAGIRCARLVAVSDTVDADGLISSLGLPLVLKTETGSGSRGARIIHRADELPASVAVPSVAESFIDGVEMSVESLVIGGAPVFVNFTEYVDPGWANLLPARLSATDDDALRALNAAAITALGIDRAFTHMEVFLTPDGPVFGELAARPPGGQIMRLISLAYGFDPWAAALAAELGEKPSFSGPASRTAAMRFLHPGAGTVQAVHGLEEVRELATCQELTCRLAPGDIVGPRVGTGQHCGFVILAGDEAQVRRDLQMASDTVHIEIEPGT